MLVYRRLGALPQHTIGPDGSIVKVVTAKPTLPEPPQPPPPPCVDRGEGTPCSPCLGVDAAGMMVWKRGVRLGRYRWDDAPDGTGWCTGYKWHCVCAPGKDCSKINEQCERLRLINQALLGRQYHAMLMDRMGQCIQDVLQSRGTLVTLIAGLVFVGKVFQEVVEGDVQGAFAALGIELLPIAEQMLRDPSRLDKALKAEAKDKEMRALQQALNFFLKKKDLQACNVHAAQAADAYAKSVEALVKLGFSPDDPPTDEFLQKCRANGGKCVLEPKPSAPSAPTGTIATYDKRVKKYRIAVPIGLAGSTPTYQEIALADTLPPGAEVVSNDVYAARTGIRLKPVWPWVVGGSAAALALMGGGIYLFAKKSPRRGRR